MLKRREAYKIPLIYVGNETLKYDAEKDGEIVQYQIPIATDNFYKSEIIKHATSDHWDDVRKRNPGTLDVEDPMYLSGLRIRKNKDGEDILCIEC